jgi:uncharacterized protein YcnI
MTWRIALRAAALLVSVAGWLLGTAGVAAAHVTVHPATAKIGSETTFTFRVPTERDDASTVKLVFALPTDTPIPAVAIRPVPGWSADIEHMDLSTPVQTDDGPVSTTVERVTWTADDAASAIAPGEFQEFVISAGPLPDATHLEFKVLQYYSDGTVVRWIDPPASDDETAHPAPTVTLTNAVPATQGNDPATTNDGSGWTGLAGLVAGLAGLAAGTTALVAVRLRKEPQG